MQPDPLLALQVVACTFALLGTWLLRKPGRWAPWGFAAWLVSNPASMVFMAANGHWWFFWLHFAFLVLAALGVWHWLLQPGNSAAGALSGSITRPGEWEDAERIRDLPAVDEALMNFKDDCTGDNATCVVRAVLRAHCVGSVSGGAR